MQYCILGTCTYSPSIVPRIYLPPTCEPASLSGPSTSRGTSSGVAWPLGLARRHLNPVMPSCHRIDDFQSRQSPQREAVSSWSIGDFRAMPYLGVVAVVESARSESLEEPVAAFEVDAEPAPDRRVTERGREERLADADRSQDQCVVAGLDEAQ